MNVLHIKFYSYQKVAWSSADKNSIAEQTAQALSYMHTLKPPMIHRDVKPMNILASSYLIVQKIDRENVD